MRALLPDFVDDPDPHALYAAGWLEEGGLRVNMISSADGAATAAGRSEGLQTPGDNRIFAALRDLADVVLVGASTAVIENYRPVEFDEVRAEIRARYGLAAQAPLALVSRSLRLDPGHRMFGGRTRTIVYTCAATDPSVRRQLAAVADVVVCGDEDVDLPDVRADLTDRGLRRILSEGGPRLLSACAEAGALDELCLSVSPVLTGPGPIRIVNGSPWTSLAHPMQLTALLEEAGALFVRYRLSA
jgi:riboflavin biosynthesis pyrimidine reductase